MALLDPFSPFPGAGIPEAREGTTSLDLDMCCLCLVALRSSSSFGMSNKAAVDVVEESALQFWQLRRFCQFFGWLPVTCNLFPTLPSAAKYIGALIALE